MYGIINMLVAYYHFHTLIDIEFETQLQTDFPAVKICNLNPIDKRKSNNYIRKVLILMNTFRFQIYSRLHDIKMSI